MGQGCTPETSLIHDECSPNEWWCWMAWDCEQTYNTSVSSFSLESSEWANANLDTGATVNAFPVNFYREGVGDGSYYDWIPGGEAWQFQGYDENGLPRSLNGRLTDAHEVLCSIASASAPAPASGAAVIGCKEQQDLYVGHNGGYMISIHSKLVREWEFILRNCWTSMEWTSSFQSVSRKALSISIRTEKRSLKKSTVRTTPNRVLRRRINSRESSMADQRTRKSSDNSESRCSTYRWWHLARGESRVDVETGNEEEESLEEGIPTLEMIQKNPTSMKEQELEDCGHAVYKSWCVVCVKDSCAGKHLQLELLEKEGRERTKPSLVAFDYFFWTQENADTTWEYENEPSPEVFQEVKIYSCVDGFFWDKWRQSRTFKISAEHNASASITDDMQCDSWTILELVVDGKSQLCNFGEEELISFANRVIQACLSDIMIEQEQFRTLPRVKLCEPKVGQDRSEWRLGIDELEKFVWQPFACGDRRNKIDGEVHWGRIRNGSYIAKNVGQGTSGSWAQKTPRDTRCLLCMEKRQNHVRMNSESESDYRENLRMKMNKETHDSFFWLHHAGDSWGCRHDIGIQEWTKSGGNFKRWRSTHVLRWLWESQRTFRYSTGFLISQENSWTRRELIVDGKGQLRNSEKRSWSHLWKAWFKECLSAIIIESEQLYNSTLGVEQEQFFMHYQEWNCTRQKLDTTDLEWRLGIDDRGNKIGNRRSAKNVDLEVECGKLCVLYANVEAHGHMGSCPGYALLIWQGKATKPRKDEFRERIGRIIERTLAGEARLKKTLDGEVRMKTLKDGIAERKRVRERRRARIERGTGEVPVDSGNKKNEAVRLADVSGGHIIENQTRREENERHPS